MALILAEDDEEAAGREREVDVVEEGGAGGMKVSNETHAVDVADIGLSVGVDPVMEVRRAGGRRWSTVSDSEGLARVRSSEAVLMEGEGVGNVMLRDNKPSSTSQRSCQES